MNHLNSVEFARYEVLFPIGLFYLLEVYFLK